MSNRGTFVDGLGDEVTFAVIIVGFGVAYLVRACIRDIRRRGVLHWLWQDNAPIDVGQLLPSEGMQIATRRSYNSDRCPICFSDFRFPVETNCGHMFCGPCLRQYFLVGDYRLQAMTCPICREQITMVFLCFTEEEAAWENEDLDEERSDVREIVLQFNRNYSGQPRTFSDYFRDLPILIRHLWREFSTLGLLIRVRMIVLLMGGVLYFIVPVDLLPEAVFGVLGFFDDILFLCVIVLIVVNLYRNFVINRFIEDQ